MAYQPIVDIGAKRVFAYEALVRGPAGEDSNWVFARVHGANRYKFDQSCRAKAIEWAARLGVPCRLSINFMPKAVYEPERCLRSTLRAATQFNFPLNNLIFEVAESERMEDVPHLDRIIRHYQDRGFMTAIDDFGAGYAGLNFLAELQTDLVKIDMGLIRGIDTSRARQAVVKAIVMVCRDLGIVPVAEGIQTIEELQTVIAMGINLVQGNLLAKPRFQRLPEVNWCADG